MKVVVFDMDGISTLHKVAQMAKVGRSLVDCYFEYVVMVPCNHDLVEGRSVISPSDAYLQATVFKEPPVSSLVLHHVGRALEPSRKGVPRGVIDAIF